MPNATPKPMKVSLVTSPKNPLGTLYYVWKQSRSNKPLPSPKEIEDLMEMSSAIKIARTTDCYYDNLSFTHTLMLPHVTPSVKLVDATDIYSAA